MLEISCALASRLGNLPWQFAFGYPKPEPLQRGSISLCQQERRLLALVQKQTGRISYMLLLQVSVDADIYLVHDM